MEDIVQWLEAGAHADYQTGVQLLATHSKNRTLVNHLVKKDSPSNRDKLRYELMKAALGGNLQAVTEATQLLDRHVAEQAAVAAVSTEAAAAVAGAVAPAEPTPAPEPEHVPEAVRSKVDDISALMTRLWNDRCQLSNQLDAASDEQGRQLVESILKLQQQYNALAERRRQLIAGEATGQPTPAQPAPAQPEASAASSTTAEAAGQLGIAQDQVEAFTASVDQAVVALGPAVDALALSDELRNVRSNLSKAKGKLAKKPDDVTLQEKVAKLTIERDQLQLQLKQAAEQCA